MKNKYVKKKEKNVRKINFAYMANNDAYVGMQFVLPATDVLKQPRLIHSAIIEQEQEKTAKQLYYKNTGETNHVDVGRMMIATVCKELRYSTVPQIQSYKHEYDDYFFFIVILFFSIYFI